jgi:hypothetical protein
MTWQSTPSGEKWVERDDDRAGPIAPPGTVTGERFLVTMPHGRADVYDWVATECGRCLPTPDRPPPPDCPCCGGTGLGPLEPAEVAIGLDIEDARLLAFGARDLAEAKADAHLLRELLATVHGDGGHYAAEHGTAKATADAITRVVALAALGRGDGEGVAW